jgi:hypothetical protein
VIVGSGDFEREEWRPQGDRIGWIEDEDLYLEPDAAFAAAQRQGQFSGDSLSVTERTLRKRLHERGLLLSVEDSRPTLAVRRTLGGRRQRVLHLSVDFLSPHTDQPDQPDHDQQEPPTHADASPPLWSGDESGLDQENPFTHKENSDVGQAGQVSDDNREYAETNGGVHQNPGLSNAKPGPASAVFDSCGGFEDKKRSQILKEGLRRLFEEHPEYRRKRPGQVGCRLHMGVYTPFAPTDEEVEVAVMEML